MTRGLHAPYHPCRSEESTGCVARTSSLASFGQQPQLGGLFGMLSWSFLVGRFTAFAGPGCFGVFHWNPLSDHSPPLVPDVAETSYCHVVQLSVCVDGDY